MKKILIFLILSLFPVFIFAQFTKVVAIGDSLFAGFASGGLMVEYQKNSIPALIAKQAKMTDFQQPYVSYPGIPPLLELKSLSPLTISQISGEQGLPLNLNLPRPYDNMAVPGATLYDSLFTTSGGMHDLILRGLGTQVEQGLSLNPDLLLVWIGNNDALGAALSGTVIDGVTITPTQTFEALYIQLLNTIKNAGVEYVVLSNIPDVTSIPFVTTIPPFIINPATGLPVYDQNGNLIPYLGQSDTGSPFVSLDSYILLTAKQFISLGYGIPVELGGSGLPLPDFTVLTPNETAMIEEHIQYFNNIIQREARNNGFALFDVYSYFNHINQEGLEIAGMSFTSDFLSGGLFSYDGVHPNAFGYACLANEFIKTLNSFYSFNIPQVALSPFAFSTTPTLPISSSNEFLFEGWEDWITLFVEKNFLWGKHRF